MQSCDMYSNRISYIGNYNAHECKIELKNVSKMDQGTWKCEVESYVWGITIGVKASAAIELKILSNVSISEGIEPLHLPPLYTKYRINYMQNILKAY